MPDRPTAEQYIAEIVPQLGKDFAAAELSYQFNMRAAHQSITDSSTLAQIVTELRSLPERYAPGRPHLLFYPSTIRSELGFVTKPFKSVVDKIYRSNVLYNRQYPLPPKTGLLEPPRLYEQIEDLIRTRLVCKYMDGPRFVCDALKQLCEKGGISNKVREHSNEAGYYAWHFYVSIPVELMLEGTVVQRNVWVEIQITTQLAEVITALTHELYETRRSAGLVPKSTDWKWEAASKEFRSAYLGHGLHLLEGIIQNLKDDVVLPSLDGGDRSQHASSLPVRVDPQSPTRADELPMRGEKDN